MNLDGTKRKIAMERESRERRVRVAYLASDVSSDVARFDVDSEHADRDIEAIENHLKMLSVAVADLRAFRDKVRDGSWVPREKDL